MSALPPAGTAGIEGLTADSGAAQMGVRIGDELWLIDVADVTEIIAPPPLLHVPFTQTWFAGVFALRGSVVGVVDFAAFTGKPRIVANERNRLLLVAPKYGINSALLFEQVIGLQNPEHFTREQRAATLPSWVESIYRDIEYRAWHSLDMRALTGHRSFLAIEASS